jgi:hypothetical protein
MVLASERSVEALVESEVLLEIDDLRTGWRS